MPIRAVATAASPTSSVLASNLDDETKSKLYTLIEAYLLLVEKPSDTQVHALAEALELRHEELEAVIYEFFSSTLEDLKDDVSEDSLDEEPEGLEALASFGLTSGDEVGDSASQDGAPDREVHGDKDPFKEASDADGAPDTEQIKENISKETP